MGQRGSRKYGRMARVVAEVVVRLAEHEQQLQRRTLLSTPLRAQSEERSFAQRRSDAGPEGRKCETTHRRNMRKGVRT